MLRNRPEDFMRLAVAIVALLPLVAVPAPAQLPDACSLLTRADVEAAGRTFSPSGLQRGSAEAPHVKR